jgi:hypothetical protein
MEITKSSTNPRSLRSMTTPIGSIATTLPRNHSEPKRIPAQMASPRAMKTSNRRQPPSPLRR